MNACWMPPVDAVADGAEPVIGGAGEAVAERHVAVRGDAHQPHAGAARVRLARALVDLLERVAHVGEAVVPAGERGLEELVRQRVELVEHASEAVVLDRVSAAVGGGDRREADFAEADLLGEVAIDADDIEVLPRQRDARADRPARVALRAAP
jgi:hypothetical protein